MKKINPNKDHKPTKRINIYILNKFNLVSLKEKIFEAIFLFITNFTIIKKGGAYAS